MKARSTRSARVRALWRRRPRWCVGAGAGAADSTQSEIAHQATDGGACYQRRGAVRAAVHPVPAHALRCGRRGPCAPRRRCSWRGGRAISTFSSSPRAARGPGCRTLPGRVVRRRGDLHAGAGEHLTDRLDLVFVLVLVDVVADQRDGRRAPLREGSRRGTQDRVDSPKLAVSPSRTPPAAARRWSSCPAGRPRRSRPGRPNRAASRR